MDKKCNKSRKMWSKKNCFVLHTFYTYLPWTLYKKLLIEILFALDLHFLRAKRINLISALHFNYIFFLLSFFFCSLPIRIHATSRSSGARCVPSGRTI